MVYEKSEESDDEEYENYNINVKIKNIMIIFFVESIILLDRRVVIRGRR